MAHRLWIIIAALLLTACTGRSLPVETQGEENPTEIVLDNYGSAPELENEVWLNSGQPLRLSDLRGKVVLVDMWTFG